MHKAIYAFLAAATISLASCDNYIDITPTGAITVDSATQYLELVANPTRAYYPSAFAMLSDNCWIKESNVIGKENISWDGINTTFNEQADRNVLADNNLYENCYNCILRENIVLSRVDDSAGADSVKALAKAEAKIMRAWDHFVLVNTFARAYNPATAKSDGGVAIMDKYDLEAKPAKASVEQTYQFILKDIAEALPLLKRQPMNVYHPSLAFGYALSALVHLFHHDWQQALDDANQSLALKSDLIDYIDLQKKGGPTKVKTYAKGGNPEVLNYAYLGSYSDNPAYTYGMISPELVKLYGNNDLRLNLFFKTTGNSVYYFDNGSGAALWNASITYSKFFYSSVGLRTAEVYLIKAEAEARLGQLAQSTQTLNTLRAKRIVGEDAVLQTPASVREAVQNVIDERRRELLFGFHRFWDLKRFNTEEDYKKTITRSFPLVDITTEHKTYTLAPDSKLYVIPFPEDARKKNPNLTNNE